MARASRNPAMAAKKLSSFITLSPPFLHFLPLSPIPSSSNPLLFSPKKLHKKQTRPPPPRQIPLLVLFAFSLLISLSLFLAASLGAVLRSHRCPDDPLPPLFSASLAEDFPPTLARSAMVPLPARVVALARNLSEAESEFWRQPEEVEGTGAGERYRPCLEFGLGYRRASPRMARERRKFLVVVASGGLNQQRNQIVDAVVIARILEASLVVPILQVNLIWSDERYPKF